MAPVLILHDFEDDGEILFTAEIPVGGGVSLSLPMEYKLTEKQVISDNVEIPDHWLDAIQQEIEARIADDTYRGGNLQVAMPDKPRMRVN